MSFLKRIIKNFPCQEKRVISCRFQSQQSPFICRYMSGSMMFFSQDKILKKMIMANNNIIPLMYLQHSNLIIKSFARYLLKLPHCPLKD